MKRFSFSLQSLLGLRISEEKKAMFELGQLNLKRNEMINEIEVYNKELNRAFELPFEKTDMTDGKTLSLMPPVFRGSRKKIENIKNKINQLDEVISEKKELILKKKSEIKSFEKMKDNEFRKFKLKYQKYEESEAESKFTMNKHRKKMNYFEKLEKLDFLLFSF